MQSFKHLFKRAVPTDLLFPISRYMSSSSKPYTGKQPYFQGTKKIQQPKMTQELKTATINSFAEHMAAPINVPANLNGDPMSVRVQDVYKQMDSSFEGFFYKRKYTLLNFNFYLQVLAEQRKFDEALKAFEKMKQLGIAPDQVSYLQLLTAASKSKDAAKAEEIFLEAKNNPKIGTNIRMYNSLIMCYTRRHEPDMAVKILREMREEGFEPDIVCYTTVINAYKNVKQVQKCWDIFEEATMTHLIPPDENLLGLMIEICAGSHDAEKAKRYFNDLINMNFKETCLPYNAMIKALGSRKDYALEAIKVYNQMVNKGILPDADTYVAVLKACGLAGDVKTAYNALMHMKQQNINMSVYTYNGLLRTYAAACSVEYVSEEIKELYLEDAWNLFKQLQTVSKLPVNVNILNSLLLVHTKAFVTEKVEGLVLPLYEKYGIKKDEFTYQHLMEMYLSKRDVDTVIRLYHVMKEEGNKPSFFAMNYFLETAMRLQNTDRIVEALQDFRKEGKEPKSYLLKRLGNADDMPDRVYLELVEFDRKYGFAADKVRRYRAKDKYSPM